MSVIRSIAIAGLWCIVSAAGGAVQAGEKPAVVPLICRLDARLPTVDFKGQELGDVVDFLRDVGGKKIFVDWNRLEAIGISAKTPVTLQLKEQKFWPALAQVLLSVSNERGKIEISMGDGRLIISGTPKAEMKVEEGK